MITTKAAVVAAPGAPFTVQEISLDGPRPGEVLVEMVAAGLCHTDLTVQAGGIPFPLPGVLGHEGAGIVSQVGAGVTKVKPFDKVLLSFTSCAHCASCRAGHPAYCDVWVPSNLINGTRDDGSQPIPDLGGHFFGQSSFAHHALVDERSLIRVADEAPLAELAPLGCGVVTGFGTVWNILSPAPGQTLAVFGSGAVGLAGIMAANLLPLSTIIAIDRVPERLDLALSLGATHTIDATTTDPAKAILEITDGHGLDHTIDTTGNPSVLRTAVDALAARGTCAIVGAPPAGTEVALDVQSLLPGKKVVGVTLGDTDPEALIPQLVALHTQGRLPLGSLIRHYSLDTLNEAAEDMHHGRTIKPVILF